MHCTVWIWNKAVHLVHRMIYSLYRPTIEINSSNYINNTIHIIIIIIMSVLPNSRPLTASAGTKAAILPKTGLPPKTQEPRLQFYQGSLGAVSFRCFPHLTLSSASEQTWKTWKDPRDINVEMRRVDLASWTLRTSPKFTTGIKHQFHQGFD